MANTSLLNLGLNDGIYCPQKCIDLLKSMQERTSLRHYSSADNDDMVEALAKLNKVNEENIYVSWGSGPILKQVIPLLIKKNIKSSFIRILKHLFFRKGFPLITPCFTYTKVPMGAKKYNLYIHYIPIRPENGFNLDISDITSYLDKQDCIVYLVNPNNPTGNPIITKLEVEKLVQKYPRSIFFIDEAYVEFLSEEEHPYIAPLAGKYSNLMVCRTFSFAYGLASAKVGYLVANKDLVAELEDGVTNYRVGLLQEKLVLSALSDENHLPFIRNMVRTEIEKIRLALKKYSNIETFPSVTHFILCRFTDGTPSVNLIKGLLEKGGIKIKEFPFDCGFDPTSYFRITIGTPEENQKLLRTIDDIIGNW